MEKRAESGPETNNNKKASYKISLCKTLAPNILSLIDNYRWCSAD